MGRCYTARVKARILIALIGLLVVMLAAPAHAQTWPTRPIRFVLGAGPGSTTDILCRLLADRISRPLGQQVLIDNRASAGAIVAAQTVASAAPDGYTYLFATTTSVVTNIHTYKSLPYDPVHDFTAVAFVGNTWFMLSATPALPADSLLELIALDKAHPGQLNFASDGPRNFSGMLGEWINKRAGLTMVQVPYAVQSKGVQDTLAGRTQLIITPTGAMRQYLESGALKAIGISSPHRLPSFATTPTLAEAVPGLEFGGWYAVFAPKATPPEIVQRMNDLLRQAMVEPAIAERLTELGTYPGEGTDTVDGVNAYWRAEIARWRTLISDIGMEPE